LLSCAFLVATQPHRRFPLGGLRRRGGMSSLERSRGHRVTINFARSAHAFDESALPPKALQAKLDVKAAKRPDLLGISQPGWNQSVVPEGKDATKFPNKPLMRQLAQYDAHKRADYNFRAEQLENADRRQYIPTTNKFQYNERHLESGTGQLSAPPALTRTEFSINPMLGLKVRWDGSTGTDKDYYTQQREYRQQEQVTLDAALSNSARHQPRAHTSVIEREKAHQEAIRAQKAAKRATEAQGLTWVPAQPPLSAIDALEMSRQVPCRKVTTWSLGSL